MDVRVRTININHGKNSILLGACKPLWKYTWLIDRIWQNRKTTAIEEAVNSAIRDMPSEYSIKPFLIIHQAEVLGVLLTEYNEVETMNLFKREWKEEGLKEGIEKGIDIGKRELMRSLVRDKTFTPVQAAQYLNISEQEFIQFMQKHKCGHIRHFGRVEKFQRDKRSKRFAKDNGAFVELGISHGCFYTQKPGLQHLRNAIRRSGE